MLENSQAPVAVIADVCTCVLREEGGASLKIINIHERESRRPVIMRATVKSQVESLFTDC